MAPKEIPAKQNKTSMSPNDPFFMKGGSWATDNTNQLQHTPADSRYP